MTQFRRLFRFFILILMISLPVSCSFDPGGLSPETSGHCGDGTIDPEESCDGTALGGSTCETLGLPSGVLACAADCTFDTAGCILQTCGNGSLDPGEECDGVLMGTQTCVTQGFTAGTLSCAANCQLDTSGCTTTGSCGDGVLAAWEQCDGDDLGGETCLGLGLGDGTLACTESCTFDFSGCSQPSCGDGTTDIGETCDDGGNDDCSGTCNADCTGPANTCGDGAVRCGEECEEGDMAGRDCTSFGYLTPEGLACVDCHIDTSGCHSDCGNGVLDSGEVCEDGNTDEANGTDDFCGALCTTESWACPGGWPGYIDPVNDSETWATLSNTELAGSSTGYAEGAAGSTITITGHYEYDRVASGCSGCQVQLYWGFFAGASPASDLDPYAGYTRCIDLVNQNTSADYTFTITLPAQPGTYYLRWARSWEYSCNYNTDSSDPSRNLAVICVY